MKYRFQPPHLAHIQIMKMAHNHPRHNTIRLLEALDDGLVSKDFVLEAALNALSDSEVHQMMLANDILIEEEE